jgi:hypothetical protein
VEHCQASSSFGIISPLLSIDLMLMTIIACLHLMLLLSLFSVQDLQYANDTFCGSTSKHFANIDRHCVALCTDSIVGWARGRILFRVKSWRLSIGECPPSNPTTTSLENGRLCLQTRLGRRASQNPSKTTDYQVVYLIFASCRSSPNSEPISSCPRRHVISSQALTFS